ncbi:hypothetical protein RB628_06310 [Streptomyces sp. ADMS]|nr:hypothetical protein [Streptomyces sp. ADMS]MDW4904970.1 hypothetical protein [Streptomyces sp. ADMS]
MELEHRVAAVLAHTQMPGGRWRILLHYDIASNRLLWVAGLADGHN